MSTIFSPAGLVSSGGNKMTEIEEIVKLMLPELLIYFKSEKISDFVQKGLDNKKNPSIANVQEVITDD